MTAMTNKERYAKYDASPAAIKKRNQRVLARRIMEKKVGAAALEGKDVHHVRDIDQGGTNSLSNLTVKSTKENRGVLRVKTNGGGKKR